MLSTVFTAMPLAVTVAVLALLITTVASVALAGLVLWRGRQGPLWPPLTLFLLGVAAWSLGQALAMLIGPRAALFTAASVIISPFAGAAFQHLALMLVHTGRARPPWGAYLLAGAVGIIGLVLGVGEIVPWRGFQGIFVYHGAGWVVVATTATLSAVGYGHLVRAWPRLQGLRRRQAGAVLVASLIGLAALAGFAFPNFDIALDPWPVLLPVYAVVLTYGILRYELMDVNFWARRLVVGLLAGLVLALGSAAIAALPVALGDPIAQRGFWDIWPMLVATLLLALAILTPLQRLATRLIFPGSTISPTDQTRWDAALVQAQDWPTLLQTAQTLLRDRLGVGVVITRDAPGSENTSAPALHLHKHEQNWAATLVGWRDAPPAPRYVATLFAASLCTAAQNLEQAERAAALERQRQQQARMAELGQLAATLAHDLRNPLNIIAMAATTSPAETRAEIAIQIGRMNQLVSDVLDFGRDIPVQRHPVPLASLVAQAARGVEGPAPEIAIAETLVVSADPTRLRQALTNLLNNASAQAKRVAVFAEPDAGGGIILQVCDDGPGIPVEIRARLFQPFVSRRPGGTGLGLAIVARIMAAHGGHVAVSTRAGWSTCMTLHFPPESVA
jgi:signal transduction histidine kinase